MPVRQLALVSELLDEDAIAFTFQGDGIHIDGKPVMAIVMGTHPPCKRYSTASDRFAANHHPVGPSTVQFATLMQEA